MTEEIIVPGKASEPTEPVAGARLPDGVFECVVTNAPLVSIDLIVRRSDGRIWLGRRKNSPAKGWLFVPGGRITKNETTAQAFERITRTELGRPIQINEAVFLDSKDHIYEKESVFPAGGITTHYVTLAYEVCWTGDSDPRSEGQHLECMWKTRQELLDSPEVHRLTKLYLQDTPGNARGLCGTTTIQSPEQYSTVSFRRNVHDTLLWQTPTLSLTAQAFLLSVAGNPNAELFARVIACLLASGVAVCTLQLFARHRRLEVRESKLLEEYERTHRHLGFAMINTKPELARSSPIGTALFTRVKRCVDAVVEYIASYPSTYWWKLMLMVFAIAPLVLLVLILLLRT